MLAQVFILFALLVECKYVVPQPTHSASLISAKKLPSISVLPDAVRRVGVSERHLSYLIAVALVGAAVGSKQFGKSDNSVPVPASKKQESNGDLLKEAQLGNLNKVKKLIQEGCSLDQCDSFDCTALHYAATAGNMAVVEVLLAAGATHTQDCWGQFPLHMAASSGAAVEVLAHDMVEKQMSLDQPDESGMSALMLAASGGHRRACEVLLRFGCSLDGLADDELPPVLSEVLMCRLVSGAASHE
mmetsp:Transcript_26796/g.59197  ORF Transcript_26796/g.59197 Transcript_26796/m.59197 type:complete len:244 (-) Transcript_26796:32-763(-)